RPDLALESQRGCAVVDVKAIQELGSIRRIMVDQSVQEFPQTVGVVGEVEGAVDLHGVHEFQLHTLKAQVVAGTEGILIGLGRNVQFSMELEQIDVLAQEKLEKAVRGILLEEGEIEREDRLSPEYLVCQFPQCIQTVRDLLPQGCIPQL